MICLKHGNCHVSSGRRIAKSTRAASFTSRRTLVSCVAVQPTRGLPQGAPDSPLIYAAVMEGVTERAEDRVRRNGRPAGVRIQWAEDPARVEEYRQGAQTFSDPESIAYINFADDTYSLARDAVMLGVPSSCFAE